MATHVTRVPTQSLPGGLLSFGAPTWCKESPVQGLQEDEMSETARGWEDSHLHTFQQTLLRGLPSPASGSSASFNSHNTPRRLLLMSRYPQMKGYLQEGGGHAFGGQPHAHSRSTAPPPTELPARCWWPLAQVPPPERFPKGSFCSGHCKDNMVSHKGRPPLGRKALQFTDR